MRNLSEKELRKLYESEYRNVPDVWDRVRDEITIEEQKKDMVSEVPEDTSAKGVQETGEDAGEQDHVLHFPRLGRRRSVIMAVTLAASFLLVFTYVLQNGELFTGYHEEGSTAAALPEDDAQGGFAEEIPTETPAGQEDFPQINEADNAAEDGVDVTDSYLNVDGVIYVYDPTIRCSSEDLQDMELLGEVSTIDSEELPKEHLTVTGGYVLGRAYLSEEGYVCILDDATGNILVYVKQ